MGCGNSESFSYLYIHAMDLPILKETSLAVSKRLFIGSVNLYSIVKWFICSPRLNDLGASYEQNPDSGGYRENKVKINATYVE